MDNMFPSMVRVRQNIPAGKVKDVRQTLSDALERVRFSELDLSGLTIGITAGSRGIYAIPIILRALADAVKEAGGHPVIVPSMGTHGGGSNKGQIEILSSLGITESAVAAAIRGSADTVLLG